MIAVPNAQYNKYAITGICNSKQFLPGVRNQFFNIVVWINCNMDRQKFQIVGLQESLHQRLLRHYDWCQLTEC